MSARLIPVPWKRPRYRKSGIAASCTFFCFWVDAGRAASDGLYRAHFPYPEAPPESVDLEHLRWCGEEAKDLVEGLWASESFAGLESTLATKLRASPRVESITVSCADPVDLGHLQAAWAMVANAVDEGAVMVKDVDAVRWWREEEIRQLDPHRPFVPAKEISMDAEPVGGFLRMQTGGMCKLGLPELGLEVAATEQGRAFGSYFMERAIELGAEGEPFSLHDEHFVEGIWIRVVRTSERPDEVPLHCASWRSVPSGSARPSEAWFRAGPPS